MGDWCGAHRLPAVQEDAIVGDRARSVGRDDELVFARLGVAVRIGRDAVVEAVGGHQQADIGVGQVIRQRGGRGEGSGHALRGRKVGASSDRTGDREIRDGRIGRRRQRLNYGLRGRAAGGEQKADEHGQRDETLFHVVDSPEKGASRELLIRRQVVDNDCVCRWAIGRFAREEIWRSS